MSLIHDDVQADFVTLTDTGQDIQGEGGYKVQKYGVRWERGELVIIFSV